MVILQVTVVFRSHEAAKSLTKCLILRCPRQVSAATREPIYCENIKIQIIVYETEMKEREEGFQSTLLLASISRGTEEEEGLTILLASISKGR